VQTIKKRFNISVVDVF